MLTINKISFVEKLLFFSIILIVQVTIVAQEKGPGGVGVTDGTDIYFWVRADEGITTETGVSNWVDQSGNGNDVAQSTANLQPTFVTSGYNSQPFVQFTNTVDTEEDKLVSSVITDIDDTSHTIFMVWDFDSTNGENQGVYGMAEAASGTANGAFSLEVDQSDGDLYLASQSDYDIDTEVATNYTNATITAVYRNSDDTVDVYQDGVAEVSAQSLSSSSDFDLGDRFLVGTNNANSTDNELDANVAEIIHFNYTLNQAEELLVYNYLSAKYNISIPSSMNAYQRDGSGFDHDVAGIGRVDSSNTNTDGQGTGIVSMDDATALGDDEFLIWGHDGTALTDVDFGTDLSSSMESRLTREWSVSEADATGDNTGVDVGDVTVRIDLSFSGNSGVFTASDLVLTVDSDGIFASGATEYACASYVSNIATFTGVSFADADFFTIGSSNVNLSINTSEGSVSLGGYKGPGGIGDVDGSNMYLWLAADGSFAENGSVVTSWSDQSGYLTSIGSNQTVFARDNNSSGNSSDERPAYGTNTANGFNSVTFDGVNDNLQRNFSDVEDDTYSIMMVWRTLTTPTDGGVFSTDDAVGTRTFEISGDGDDTPTNATNLIFENNGTNHTVSAIGDVSSLNITTITRDAAHNIDSYINNTAASTTNIGAGNGNTFERYILGIDRDESVTASGVNMDLYEFIVFQSEVNTAQRYIIQNYLAAKYGLTLTAGESNDVYDIYEGDESGEDYDFEVAGIGQASSSDFNKDARGTGIVRIYNPSDLGNDEYLMWGHDNGSLTAINDTDVPNTANDQRTSRVWAVSENNSSGTSVSVGTVTVEVDMSFSSNVALLTTADLELWVDSDGVFTSVTTTVACTSYVNGIATFTGVDFTDGDYFTVASNGTNINLIVQQGSSAAPGHLGPGGVGNTDGTSGILLWFNADDLTIGTDNIDAVSDLSGNGYDLTELNNANTATAYPDCQTDAGFNNQKVIVFDAAEGDGLEDKTIVSMTDTSWSLFFVYNSTDTGVNEKGLFSTRDGNDGSSIELHSDGTGLNLESENESDNQTIETNLSSTATLISVTRNTSDVLAAWNDETSSLSASIGSNRYDQYRDFLIGVNRVDGTGSPNEANDHLSMNLGELVFMNETVSDIQRLIVSNYLAAKYGLTLNASSDIYDGDDNVNGDYDFDVIGIGDDTNDVTHLDSKGTGVIRINNPTAIATASTSEYMFIGSDSTDYTFSSLGASADYIEQLNANWYVVESADAIGNVDVIFELADLGLGSVDETCLNGNLMLAFDDDGDGNFGEAVDDTTQTLTVSAGVAYVLGYNLNNGDEFTLQYRGQVVVDNATWYGTASSTTPPDTDDDCFKLLVTGNSPGTGDAVIDQDIEVSELEVSDGSTMVVNTGISVTLQTGAVNTNSSGEIKMLGTSQLIQNHTGASSNSGDEFYNTINVPASNEYAFKYLSSPVSSDGSSYTLGSSTNNLKDGTTALAAGTIGSNITFTTNREGSQGTTPITVSSRWIETYFNNTGSTDWVRVRDNTAINIGEGFTMKAPGTSAQDYIFNGIANSGDYTKSLTANTFSLLGNPYPSALDAEDFIVDNINVITGTLYFYQQDADTSSHATSTYEAGYGAYSLAGGVAASTAVSGVAGLPGIPVAPARYIPVGQGFFVQSSSSGGTLTFQNSQRNFQVVDGSNSKFFGIEDIGSLEEENDDSEVPFIKLGMEFDLGGDKKFHRQLGVAFKEGNSKAKFDNGYDSYLFDEKPTDMYWNFEEDKLVIAGVGKLSKYSQLPISLNVDVDRTIYFSLDEVKGTNRTVYLLDAELGYTEELTGNVIEKSISETSTNRFSLVFDPVVDTTLSEEQSSLPTLDYLIAVEEDMIRVTSSKYTLKNVVLYDITGKIVSESAEGVIYKGNNKPSMKIINVIFDEGVVTKKITF